MLQYKFDAQLNIKTVSALYKTLYKTLTDSKSLELNLSSIVTVDSAGIAFLLELKSIAKQKNCTLIFTEAPDIIEHFCQLYQVTL